MMLMNLWGQECEKGTEGKLCPHLQNLEPSSGRAKQLESPRDFFTHLFGTWVGITQRLKLSPGAPMYVSSLSAWTSHSMTLGP